MKGRTIIVTGATSGIGKATALHCAGLGAKVVAAGRRQPEGDALVQEILQAGGEATFVQTDVTQESDVEQLLSQTMDTYGQLDFAFNNAGIFDREGLLHEHDGAQWQAHIAAFFPLAAAIAGFAL